MKKKEWVPFVSLGVAQAALMLGIAGFGFAHLNARMDRLEERLNARMDRIEARMDRIEARMDRIDARLDGLDRRVSRIEGVLRLRPIEETEPGPAGTPGNGP